ncbi:MAG: DUF4389 domain-containing protein [Actinomycetota bacterium]
MTYPATFTLDAPEKIARWRPLVQWFLAIPHFIVLYFYGILAQLLAVVAWFVILFTGKLPEGIARIIIAYSRYNTRVTTYAGFLHDQYPKFAFPDANDDPGDFPVAVSYQPALDGRNRLTVLVRMFWAIPALLFFYVVYLVAWIVWFLGFFVVIVLGAWPTGMRNFVAGALRVGTRFGAYLFLLTDEYPPFSVD